MASSLWQEHQRKAECMIALIMHITGDEIALSGAGGQVLEEGSPRVCPVRVASILEEFYGHDQKQDIFVQQ